MYRENQNVIGEEVLRKPCTLGAFSSVSTFINVQVVLR
jgi:hypothetical protein